MNWIGGFIGYVNLEQNSPHSKNCKENVNILGRYKQVGLVGAMDGSIQASNMEFINVVGVTNNSGLPLLVGTYGKQY